MVAHTVAKVKDEFTMLFEVDTYFHSCSCRPAAHSYRACFVAGEPGRRERLASWADAPPMGRGSADGVRAAGVQLVVEFPPDNLQ